VAFNWCYCDRPDCKLSHERNPPKKYQVTISAVSTVTVDADNEADAIQSARDIFSLWTSDSLEFEVIETDEE